MKIADTHKIAALGLVTLLLTGLACNSEKTSLFDPNYEPSRQDPAITKILPEGGYLAGVDSLIIQGERFASDLDSLILSFDGVPGTIYRSSADEMVVRPGYVVGNAVGVRIAVRGATGFSNVFSYKLDNPFFYIEGTNSDFKPVSPIAIDEDDNLYVLVDNAGTGRTRYTKIAPDGTVTTDGVKKQGEGAPSAGTMRFANYSSMNYVGAGRLFMTQQGTRAIFEKTFGDDKKEGVWVASSTSSLKIFGAVIDNKGYLWVVGSGSNQIHRFEIATKAEAKFPFTASLTAVAYYNDKLFVGGKVNNNVEIWTFPIEANGDLGAGELYFDFQAHYNGAINSMIFADDGNMIIATTAEEKLVELSPNGKHRAYYQYVTKTTPVFLTWRSGRMLIVGVDGGAGAKENNGIYNLDTFNKSRAGIYYE